MGLHHDTRWDTGFHGSPSSPNAHLINMQVLDQEGWAGPQDNMSSQMTPISRPHQEEQGSPGPRRQDSQTNQYTASLCPRGPGTAASSWLSPGSYWTMEVVWSQRSTLRTPRGKPERQYSQGPFSPAENTSHPSKLSSPGKISFLLALTGRLSSH